MSDKTDIDELIENINSNEPLKLGAITIALKQFKVYLEPKKDWSDRDDELTEAIDALHPCETGDHKTYTKAMELIGNRHSKGSLVCLVNYFLVREKQHKVMEENDA